MAKSELTRSRDTTQAREATPESGDKGEKGQKPEARPDAQDESPDGSPDDPKASPEDAKLAPGSTPPAAPGERTPVPGSAADQWGDLPVQARDVFRSQGGADLPVRYREWIDAYYKRLNSDRSR